MGSIPDLSYTFFYLLAFYLYVRSTERKDGSPFLFSLSLVSFALALLCKEPAMSLLLILPAYDYITREEFPGNAIRRYIPYIAVAALYLTVRFAVLSGLSVTSWHGSEGGKWLLNIPFLFSRYLWKLVLPTELNAFYSFRPVDTLTDLRLIIGILVGACFLISVYMAFRKKGLAFLSLVIIAVPLLPALYVPAIGGTPFGERYLYLPSVGFVLMLTLILSRFKSSRKTGTGILIIAFFVIAAFYASGTVSRNKIWKDDYHLWGDVVKKSPNSDIGYNNLGRAYFIRGNIDQAIDNYQKALRLNPGNEEAHGNLGAAFASKNIYNEAERHFLIALELRPGYSDAHNNIGILYGTRGHPDKAIAHFKEAIKSRPDFADAHHNLGVTYLNKGMVDLAIQEFRKTLRLNPDAVNTHLNLSKAYGIKGLKEKLVSISREHESLPGRRVLNELQGDFGTSDKHCCRVLH